MRSHNSRPLHPFSPHLRISKSKAEMTIFIFGNVQRKQHYEHHSEHFYTVLRRNNSAWIHIPSYTNTTTSQQTSYHKSINPTITLGSRECWVMLSGLWSKGCHVDSLQSWNRYPTRCCPIRKCLSLFSPYKFRLPSGELTFCYGKWPFIVDFPIQNGDCPLLC